MIDQIKQETVTIGHRGRWISVLVSNENQRKTMVTCIQQMTKTF